MAAQSCCFAARAARVHRQSLLRRGYETSPGLKVGGTTHENLHDLRKLQSILSPLALAVSASSDGVPAVHSRQTEPLIRKPCFHRREEEEEEGEEKEKVGCRRPRAK